MYDFCVQKPSINQKGFYAKGCEIDRTGYKIFFLGKKKDVLSVPSDLMSSLHIHLRTMMGLFVEKTGDMIAVLNTNRLLSEERE